MFRKLAALFITTIFCWTTVACAPSPSDSSAANRNTPEVASPEVSQLSEGKYPVQQATYDDATGEYTLMLLNTPSGTPPLFRTTNLQMARLTDEAIQSGEKTYLEVVGDQAVMYLTEDFKIEYIHTVTENQVDPQTGQPQTVIVERQSSFWTPFAGALAGQALGSLLFRPQYYVPPVYQPGGGLVGYGGYGRTYSQAVDRYQTRYQAPPAAVRNRQVLRTTGRLRSPTTTSTGTRRIPSTTNRPTGSGYGSNTLRTPGRSSSTRTTRPSSRFGSKSGSPRRIRSRRR